MASREYDHREMFTTAVAIALQKCRNSKVRHPEDAANMLVLTVEVLAAAETIRLEAEHRG